MYVLHAMYHHDIQKHWQASMARLKVVLLSILCTCSQIQTCSQLQIHTIILPLSSQIIQEDIDFHQYYSNGRLEDLKFRMDEQLYPPRRKARVQAKHKSFFESSKSLDFQLTCGKKCINGKIIIPGSKGMCVNCEVSHHNIYINRYI